MALAVFFAVGAGLGLMFLIWWVGGLPQDPAPKPLLTEADPGSSPSAPALPPPPPPSSPPPLREPQLQADADLNTNDAAATGPDDGTHTKSDNGPDGLADPLGDAPAPEDDPEDDPDDSPDDDPASDFLPATPLPTAVAKKPVPALSERQEIRRTIDDICPEPQNRHEALELANKLAALADATEHPTERFVLLQRASELASEGGDVRGMLAQVDRLAENFEIDLWTVKASFLRSAAKRNLNTTQRRELAEQMLEVAEQALDGEAFAAARELAKLALAEGGRLRDKDIVAWSRESSEQVAAAAEVSAQAQDARASLIDNPNDPEANLVVGSYLCFFKGDWGKGFPHLANGSDPALMQLAQQEVAAATGQLTAVAPMELADGWWELARNADSHRGAILLRAGYWYQQAIDGTEPETLKTTIDRRLQTIDKETSIPSLRRRHRGHHLMVTFKDQALAHKHLDWNGEWQMTDDGGKAERINRSFVRTRQAYAGNLRIMMDFSLGRCRYSNTGQCTINVWGKSLEVSGGRQWRGLRARVFIYRGGNNIVFVLNDKVQRIPLTPEMWAEPTTVSVHWRHRESHFRHFELSAETVCVPDSAGTTAFFELKYRMQNPFGGRSVMNQVFIFDRHDNHISLAHDGFQLTRQRDFPD